jgi:hypothetical protein
MNPPSDEQQMIINDVQQGNNVIVNACAGSGKSTTILSCAIALPQLKFIQITFNKQLQSEIQEKVNELKLKNISVYTFHGLAVKYYSSDCHNDMGIRRVLRDKVESRAELPDCDVMVLDETQDMTNVYFDLIWKFMLEINTPMQLLILGDEKQGLYGFKGSDSRFLTLGHLCWETFPNLSNPHFIYRTLQMSYRITDTMCQFLNKAMLGTERVKSCKPGVPVTYIRRSFYQKPNGLLTLYSMIIRIMKEQNAKYDDFFILCRSLKSTNKIVRMLENLLVQHNIPCFIPNNDCKEDLDTRVIQNKLVFSTFHSAKGRQRPYVIVLGFDDSHFSHFAKDKDPLVCPNELYVGCTRATTKLFLWENIAKRTFTIPFLKYNHNQLMTSPFVSFNGIPSGRKPEKVEYPQDELRKQLIHPSDLVRFLSEQTLDVISPLVDELFETITAPSEIPLDIPTVHLTSSGFCEDVSDINGIVLPLMYFDHLRETYEPVLQNLIFQNMKYVPNDEHTLLHDSVKNMPETCESTRDYLYLANLFTATQTLLYSRFKQIALEDYNWIPQHHINICFENLDKVLREECLLGEWTPEKYIIQGSDELEHVAIDAVFSQHLKNDNVVYRFSARADIITETSLWELKCTSQLTMDHKLQLIIYAWLYQMKYEGLKEKKELNYFLFNIKTNEHLQLKASLDQLTTIILTVVKNKYTQIPELTDDEFIAKVLAGTNTF